MSNKKIKTFIITSTPKSADNYYWVKKSMGNYQQIPIISSKEEEQLRLIEDFLKVDDILQHKGSKVKWKITNITKNWAFGELFEDVIGRYELTLKSLNSKKTKIVSTYRLRHYDVVKCSPGLKVLFMES